MAALSNTNLSPGGAAYSLAAASAGGDTFVDDGRERTFLAVANASGGSINVTIAAQKTAVTLGGYGSLTVADKVVAVPAGSTKLIGPFPDAYRAPGGVVSVAYSAVTSVTVGAFYCQRQD